MEDIQSAQNRDLVCRV